MAGMTFLHVHPKHSLLGAPSQQIQYVSPTLVSLLHQGVKLMYQYCINAVLVACVWWQTITYQFGARKGKIVCFKIMHFVID